MKKVEILTTFRSGGQSFYAGEVRFVQPDAAVRFCRNGWAKDVSGELPTEAPNTAPQVLSISDGVHAAASESA